MGGGLNWLKSFLTNRTFSVKIGNFTSSLCKLTCGVPQGSVLAPTLFSLYLLPLESIFRKHGVSFHCYTDDMQIYLPVTTEKKHVLNSLSACLDDIKSWLSKNLIFLNSDKSEVIVFGPSETRAQNILKFCLNFVFVRKSSKSGCGNRQWLEIWQINQLCSGL